MEWEEKCTYDTEIKWQPLGIHFHVNDQSLTLLLLKFHIQMSSKRKIGFDSKQEHTYSRLNFCMTGTWTVVLRFVIL